MLLLALLVAAAPAPPGGGGPAALSGEADTARYVVVMGYNGGAPDPRAPLRFSDDDAARLFELLSPSSERAFLLATFDAESAKLFPELTDVAREPTREQLAQVLGEVQWLVRAKKKQGVRTELVFAFAGHGDVNDAGEGYVVLADGPFTRTDLETQVIDPSPADVNHVIIDACSSYFMVSRGGDAKSGVVALTPKVLNVLKGTTASSAAARARTGVLVSTSGAAEVHESGELESGVFSFLLRSALAGAADNNGDGRVEYAEAAAFISAASAGLDDPRAKLSVHAEAPLQRPHVALMDLARSGATRFLKVDGKQAVHVRILDAHGVPYAELNRAAGHGPVVLALQRDPFYVVQEGQKEALLVPRAAGAYALSSLSFEDSPAPRAASEHLRGLFATPYGDDVVTGFLGASEMAPPLDGTVFDPPYAEKGTPPLRLPLSTVALVTLGVAGAVGLAAGGAVVGNELSFSKLQADFARTGTLDPQTSLQVESWRTGATALTLGAVALGLAGGGLYLWSTTLPEGEVELR